MCVNMRERERERENIIYILDKDSLYTSTSIEKLRFSSSLILDT